MRLFKEAIPQGPRGEQGRPRASLGDPGQWPAVSWQYYHARSRSWWITQVGTELPEDQPSSTWPISMWTDVIVSGALSQQWDKSVTVHGPVPAEQTPCRSGLALSPGSLAHLASTSTCRTGSGIAPEKRLALRPGGEFYLALFMIRMCMAALWPAGAMLYRSLPRNICRQVGSGLRASF